MTLDPHELTALETVSQIYAKDGSGATLLDIEKVVPTLVIHARSMQIKLTEAEQRAAGAATQRDNALKQVRHLQNVAKGTMHSIGKYRTRIAELEAQVAELEGVPAVDREPSWIGSSLLSAQEERQNRLRNYQWACRAERQADSLRDQIEHILERTGKVRNEAATLVTIVGNYPPHILSKTVTEQADKLRAALAN